MKRIFTSFIAPCIFCLSFLTLDTLTGSKLNVTNSPFLFEFLIIYSYSFLFFLFIGIPVSMLIDKIIKGVRALNYVIAGGIVGLIIHMINILDGHPLLYDVGIFIVYPVASLLFYFVLKGLEIIFTKAFGERVSNLIH